eukprot:352088-Chlamydomonas_euryale.AAC.15
MTPLPPMRLLFGKLSGRRVSALDNALPSLRRLGTAGGAEPAKSASPPSLAAGCRGCTPSGNPGTSASSKASSPVCTGPPFLMPSVRSGSGTASMQADSARVCVGNNAATAAAPAAIKPESFSSS